MSMIAVRISDDIEERLNALAKQTGRTKTFYVREAILKYIEDLEDIYIANDVLERVRKGEEDVYSHESMRKEIGLDN